MAGVEADSEHFTLCWNASSRWQDIPVAHDTHNGFGCCMLSDSPHLSVCVCVCEMFRLSGFRVCVMKDTCIGLSVVHHAGRDSVRTVTVRPFDRRPSNTHPLDTHPLDCDPFNTSTSLRLTSLRSIRLRSIPQPFIQHTSIPASSSARFILSVSRHSM